MAQLQNVRMVFHVMRVGGAGKHKQPNWINWTSYSTYAKCESCGKHYWIRKDGWNYGTYCACGAASPESKGYSRPLICEYCGATREQQMSKATTHTCAKCYRNWWQEVLTW